jgi:acetyltransferase-like isoleucine patch superfamily enzyme
MPQPNFMIVGGTKSGTALLCDYFFRFTTLLLPWRLRRWVLVHGFGYYIHPTARIGFSWIFPRHLSMGEDARIGHLTVAINLDRMVLGSSATISRGNWITGFPRDGGRHFAHRTDRDPALVMGDHSAITKHHHLDCTDRIEIGAFSTIAGYGSQLLTHSIDLELNRQDAAPIRVGEHCFVGTDVVILGGARLPDRSVLSAKAVLDKAYEHPGWIYVGAPARPMLPVADDAAYFRRTTGFVV